jgi:hypothetical protein
MSWQRTRAHHHTSAGASIGKPTDAYLIQTCACYPFTAETQIGGYKAAGTCKYVRYVN